MTTLPGVAPPGTPGGPTALDKVVDINQKKSKDIYLCVQSASNKHTTILKGNILMAMKIISKKAELMNQKQKETCGQALEQESPG